MCFKTRGCAVSLLHEVLVFEKYGMRLNIDQLAEALGLTRNTIYNQISQGTFKIKTYVDGGRRFADYRDFAIYLDLLRESAR